MKYLRIVWAISAKDIADVVAFLAGEDGRWISGQNIRANGALA